MEGFDILGLPPSKKTARNATPSGFGASMLDYAGSGRDSKAQYAKPSAPSAPRRSMLDAFRDESRRMQNLPVHRVRPLEVFNEQPQGQWPEPKVRRAAVAAGAATSTHSLQIVDATTGNPPVATVRVRAGSIGGQVADSLMDLADDDPVFSFSVSGAAVTKYIYCTVTMEYSTTTGIWSLDTTPMPDIGVANSLPAASATTMIVPIGSVAVVSDAGGYRVSTITQTVSGNQWIARTGSGTVYVDANGLL